MEATTSTFVLRTSIHGHTKDVRALSPLYFPEGSFVSGSRDVSAKIWTPSGSDNGFCEGMAFGGHSNFISAVCVLPPSDQFPHGLILTGSNDKTILAYDLESPQPRYKLTGHEDTVCSLAAGKFGTVISASWDKTARVWLGEKCVLHLKGHEAAVWCVALIPTGGFMLTGSADKTIRLWKTGVTERTFRGHEDCVRGLVVLNPQEFLSCSNDFSIRRWMVSGECAATYYGHTGYVYAVACLPNGRDFVSCGEDRTLRVWEDENLVQTITHPTQSVWTVCVLQNGDIATGGSDGVIRVFTKDPALVADAEELVAFEESVAKTAIPAQIGDIKTDDLPGPEVLVNPGKREGQMMMVRCGNSIEAHQWSSAGGRWVKVGDVVGGSGSTQGSSGKVDFEGKQYDYVFDVDLGSDMPALKLPYNLNEDPWMAAHNFLERNDLSQSFLDQVANFITQQTEQLTLGTVQGAAPCDPFTGAGRYIPGSERNQPVGQFPSNPLETQHASGPSSDPFTGGSRYQPSGATNGPSQKKPSYFPESSYISFGTINKQGVFGKLNEFRSQSGKDVSETDLKELEKLVETGGSEATALQMDILWRLMQWPTGILFPVLDILRHVIRYPRVNQNFCNTKDGDRFLSYCCDLLSTDGQPKNHLLAVRVLCNTFHHPDGEQTLLKNPEQIFERVSKLHAVADKTTRVAISSLVLNFVVGFCKMVDAEGKTRCLLLIKELTESNLDDESIFRFLVAVGTAITNDSNCKDLTRSLNFRELISKSAKSNQEKVKDCARMLAEALT